MTLIELIVALAIGSMVIAAVLAVLTSATKTQQVGEQRADLLQSVRVSLDQIERDLQFAVTLSTDTTGQYTFTGTDSGTGDVPLDELEFTTASGDPLASLMPTGDLLRVRLYIDTDEKTEQVGLVRSSLRLPLPEEISQTEAELSARTYCPWAVGLDFQYYDTTASDWVQEWTDRTDLPSAVRVVLYVLPGSSEQEDEREPQLQDVLSFSTVVQLAMASQELGTGQPENTESGTGGSAEAGGQGGPGQGQGAGGSSNGGLPNLPGMGQLPGLPTRGTGGQ